MRLEEPADSFNSGLEIYPFRRSLVLSFETRRAPIVVPRGPRAPCHGADHPREAWQSGLLHRS